MSQCQAEPVRTDHCSDPKNSTGVQRTAESESRIRGHSESRHPGHTGTRAPTTEQQGTEHVRAFRHDLLPLLSCTAGIAFSDHSYSRGCGKSAQSDRKDTKHGGPNSASILLALVLMTYGRMTILLRIDSSQPPATYSGEGDSSKPVNKVTAEKGPPRLKFLGVASDACLPSVQLSEAGDLVTQLSK